MTVYMPMLTVATITRNSPFIVPISGILVRNELSIVLALLFLGLGALLVYEGNGVV
jgi:hypothetical protein